MARIAILHYTAQPCVGGVEHIIEAQRNALVRFGCPVRLIVGAGGTEGDVVCIPELLPPQGGPTASIPAQDDPNVQGLKRSLRAALDGCVACWVHNAFTVYLHPALTVALIGLVNELTGTHWVAFCHDLTQRSRFWPALSHDERLRVSLPATRITYVTDSEVRRAELAAEGGIDRGDIRVVSPPLDTEAWVGISAETLVLTRSLALGAAGLVAVVPAKLLPHKNLELVVRIAAELRDLTERSRFLITGAPSPHDAAASAAVHRRIVALAGDLGVGDNIIILADKLGRTPSRRTIRDLMMLGDLVFLPSVEEGFGLPLQEAMALRVPIVCSDIPPFREVANGYADFFPLDEPPRRTAQRAAAIANSPANRRRRAALQSQQHFEEGLRRLLEDSKP